MPIDAENIHDALADVECAVWHLWDAAPDTPEHALLAALGAALATYEAQRPDLPAYRERATPCRAAE